MGLTVLLIATICLMPVKVSQNEAKAATPVTTTALLTASVTFIIHTALRWIIGRTLTEIEERLLQAASRKSLLEAYVNISGAFWTSNSYEHIYKIEGWGYSNQRSPGTWITETVTAS